jgi:FtsP/CotA-like multicopper oxidase with cupredoxin domain
MQGRFGDGVLVNAVPQPALTVPTGTMERWRILNASASRYYPLRLDGARWWQISSDGGRLASPVNATGLVLAPGERAEVLVAVDQATTVALTAAAWQTTTGMGGMGGASNQPSGATETILTVIGTGPDTTTPTVGGALNNVDSLADAHVDGTRDFTFAMGGMMGGGMGGMAFTINGRSFDPERIDIEAALGTVEDWTVTNTTPMAHPFHLHVWPFQIMETSDRRTPITGWKDVVDVPAGGWVRLRVAFRDFAGRTLYHCHILDHEDLGMMGIINVT